MSPNTDLQTVLQQFLPSYRNAHTLSPRQAEVCRHIQTCRTEALGGVQLHCDQCDYTQPWYGACRDRHCPKCQWRATQRWTDQQCAAVLAVTYYHVVFTLPPVLNPWVILHPEVIYGLFFQTVWATLKAFSADPKRLGGQLGATMVLHTWGQQLNRHVHIHCLIPGGALTQDGYWQVTRGNYLFPDRAMARHLRGGMVSALRKAYQADELHRITRRGEVDTVLDQLMHTDWVVYTKPWLKQPETVVAYLARYTFRIALSDARIGEITDTEVELHYKDYQDNDRWKTLNLSGEELIRRYLQHVLPKGLMRVRHYGFLANRCRRQKLAQIRALLDQPPVPDTEEDAEVTAEMSWRCPRCHQGHLQAVKILAPQRLQRRNGH